MNSEILTFYFTWFETITLFDYSNVALYSNTDLLHHWFIPGFFLKECKIINLKEEDQIGENEKEPKGGEAR